MKKKILSIAIATTLILGLVALTGCGSSKEEAKEKKTIVVGATPEPHAEILKKVKPILEKKGYTLEIKEFTDYVTPNTALQDGEIDANFYQHIPYLEEFNKEKKTDLSYTVKVHLEPMGVYSKTIKDLKELKNGATISIPSDPTNGSRALKLLEKEGIIKLKEGELVSKMDITKNPKNIKIEELDAAQLPRTLGDVDAAVINTNYAVPANLNPLKDALAIESKDSPYANVIVVKTENKNTEYIKALDEAINSEEIKKYIEEQYKGAILPAF
ncbi:MetQ/NlpA family ABC transporter substrate-binding protein [Clostridium botulinum]|uniref:MetQ/NlpA family ABC transporter substrate-binding protein n=1 Tax=Clostridium botulinum TaxID=1491 RepID=UPI0006A72F86|nr:MetQ/NlpA family ABC transporter substrate-binding protein [Clostridium botulinum]KON11279.1 methionine ABC transporter substrate-binding protein [Clostridium botulinum]MBY6897427.1 MetQ/NlpA family ABC transporter substrate-binding protein [Clostridium botulinum]MBY6905046.1 MetQ/NlpA family ABC transporter substrate-binding protein [Clostridium botulinum]MBY6911741.1 MetQ/NlpA family ABC transporter substrate-binding protein [Clostridium botulinum]MBY6926499.1 MetQ/NlpA family ABC transpo